MERDVMSVSIDVEKSPTFRTLGDAGEGKYEAIESQQDRLEELTNRIGSGEYHCEIEERVPCRCVDDRCFSGGVLMPNAAGGSKTMMVADDLTTKGFELGGVSTTSGQYEEMLKFLTEKGTPIGVHIDCGANNKLQMVYDYIARNEQKLRSTAVLLGYEIKDSDHGLIVSNATKRTDFSEGDEIIIKTKEANGRVDEPIGDHEPVLIAINRREATTLDREAVRDEFGDHYKAFNVDEWSFDEAARLISSNDSDEIRQKRTAMLYYNLATAGVLCGPNMRIVIIG